MREVKLLELVTRPLFSHRKASVYRRPENKESVGLAQMRNFSVVLRRNSIFFQIGTNSERFRFDLCRREVTQKRSFSVGERRNLKFLQFSTHDNPCEVRLGCLKGDCVVDLNAEAGCIPTTMLDLLRYGPIGSVRS